MYKTITLMLISLVSTIALSLVSPVLASLATEFPNESISTITLIVTITSFAIIPGMFISTALVSRIDRKKLIIFGYFLVLIGGMAPAFLNSVSLILVSRAALGLGVGLTLPLQATYFSEYPSAKRPMLMGLSQAIVCIINAGMLILSSQIAQSGWRNVFLLYGVCIIIIVMVLTGIPKSAPLKNEISANPKVPGDVAQENKNISRLFVKLCISQFFTMSASVGVSSLVSFYIVNYNLGGVAGTEAYMINSISTLCMAAACAAFSYILKLFKGWSGTMVLFIAVIAFVIYAFPLNIIIIGIGFTLINTFLSLYSLYSATVIVQIMPRTKVAAFMTISSTAVFGGMFVAPYVMSALSGIMGTQPSENVVYFGYAVIIFIIAIVNLPFANKSTNRK